MLTEQAGGLRAGAERRIADIDSRHGVCLTFPLNGGTCENKGIKVWKPHAGCSDSPG